MYNLYVGIYSWCVGIYSCYMGVCIGMWEFTSVCGSLQLVYGSLDGMWELTLEM
jgi:hypothetical protein